MPEVTKKQTTQWILDGKRVKPGTPGATQRVVLSAKWYGRVNGRPIPLCTDKAKSRQMLARHLSEAALDSVGLGDQYRDHKRKPLAEHLEDYHRGLLAEGCSEDHANLVKSRCDAVLTGCGFLFFPDLSASRLSEWLAQKRQKPRAEGGISIQTSNHYLANAKAFVTWLVKDRRTADNPFRHLERGNVKLDRRHDRRE